MPPRKKQPTGPVPVEAFKHEDKRVNIPTADSSELVSPDVAQPTQLGTPAKPRPRPAARLAGQGRAGRRGPGCRRAADLHPGEDRPPGHHREPAQGRREAATVAVRRVRRARGVRGRRVLPARGQLVEPDDPGRLAPGDGVPRGKGKPAGEGADGVPRPAVWDQVRVELAGTHRQCGRYGRQGSADVTREVEQIKAFRDTWE